MFNYRLYRTASLHTNYFYDLLRSGNYEIDKFKEDYIKFYNRFQISSSMIEGLDFLLSYPQIINDLTDLRFILSNYGLKFDDVLKFDRSFYSNPGTWNPLRQHIIDKEQELKHPEISWYDYNQARFFLQSYNFDLALLKEIGDEDYIEKFGQIYTKENSLKSIEEKKAKAEIAKKTIESFEKKLQENKNQELLPGYSHSFTQIETVALRANNLIKNILSIVGESNIKSIKYFVKDTKFFNPLFERSIESPIESTIESEKVEENENDFDLEKSNLSKDEFINYYLQNHALPFSNQNNELIEKVENIWEQCQKDNNFLSKCTEMKKAISETFGSKNVDFNKLLISIDKENNKFRFKRFRWADFKWYAKQLEFLEENKEAYTKAKNFNNFVSDIKDKANVKSQMSQNKIIIKDYEYVLDIVQKFRDEYLEWAKDIIIEPSGKSLAVLFNVYEKINNALNSLIQLNYYKSEFINNYLKDDRLGSFFGEPDKLSTSRKFEITLENYIKIDRKKRLVIVKKLTDPIAFRRILKNEFPDLLRTLIDENFMDKKGNLYNEELYSIKSNLIKTMNISSSELKEVPSKYFSDFNLNNSSESEKALFSSFEKLGLHAIPATQEKVLNMTDSEGNSYGFRIDFLLPCNVRVYDDKGNYSLREDIIFVGEYFGFYGPKYEAKTEKKIEMQNMIENSLDQRCLHIKDIRNLCPVLEEKNIDSRCFPDYKKQLFDIENNDVRKEYFVKSQMQHFLYSYLVDELMWQINYYHSESTIINYEKIKEKNLQYIIRFENLIKNSKELSPIELRKKCSEILNDYKRKFEIEKKQGERIFRTSARYKITIR